MDFLKNLPDRYIFVRAKDKRLNKDIGLAILDKKAVSLFLFSSAGVMEYSGNEIFEVYNLFNPVDGFEYDLNKVL